MTVERTASLNRMFADWPVESGTGVRALELTRERVRLDAPLSVDVPFVVPLVILADDALGAAIHGLVPMRSEGPTLELRVDVVAAPTPGAETLVATGGQLGMPTTQDGRSVAQIVVRDDQGETVATVVGVMVLRDHVGLDSALWEAARAAPRFDAARLVADVAAAPVRDGELSLAPNSSWNNMQGTVHGGLVLAVGVLASDRLAGGGGRLLSATVEFIRPLPLDGVLTCRSTPERAGRRFRSRRTELVLPDGRVGAVVRCTTGTVHPDEATCRKIDRDR